MVSLVRHDLEFILKQIQIAEAHSAGTPLTAIRIDANGDITTDPSVPLAIPTPLSPYGLRTVDGSYNNLTSDREQWGASGEEFLKLLTSDYRNEQDGDSMQFGPPNSPYSPPPLTNTDYGIPGNVADADPRIISNLIVDQTLENPAAIYAALTHAGVAGAEITAAHQAISTAHVELKLAAEAEAVAIKAEASVKAEGSNATADEIADATAARIAAMEATSDAKALLDTTLQKYGVKMDGNTVVLPNVAPDEGLSAPYNSWFTLFGQFFDHGLDLVTKGGSGTVYIPLQPDDPLYVEGGHTNFMAVTRINQAAPHNLTTPFVDQNQTYTSHASHQVFLREYKLVDGKPVATGRLLEGERGLATWGDVKAQAREMLRIELTDDFVGSVPLVRTDAYGNFIPGENGFPQVAFAVETSPGIYNMEYRSGSPDLLLDLTGAARIANAFLDDIAHAAVPVLVNGVLQTDGDSSVGYSGGLTTRGAQTHYDNELLDAHYITGDGRGNENIGLSAVHHIFHSEHNHLVDQVKQLVLSSGDLAFLNEWLLQDTEQLPQTAEDLARLEWDGTRLFAAARFTNEMQYQHLVFEEFARKVQPDVDAFVFNASPDVNPAIFAEFAHVVYRFGHSMLKETVDSTDANGVTTQMKLFDAFLNPLAFGSGTVDHATAAGAIVRGMTAQVGSEIDEFVTGVLRNELVGLPLDLAAINIARARDAGIPALNEARRQFKEMANGDTQLDPYTSWSDFALNLKNPASIVNFIAAYGTHETITTAATAAAKRDAAMKLVFGDPTLDNADRLDFLNARGAYGDGDLGGLEQVDLWVGGLAEKKMAFGGMLGSTFSFVFELQLENLQNGDRFYYLSRVQGLNLLNELENNSLAKMVMNNTDLGAQGYALPGDIFSTPDHVLYIDPAQQEKFGTDEPTQDNPFLEAVVPMVERREGENYIRYNGLDHVVIAGTNQDDTIIAGGGDDAVWGFDGKDQIEAGYGVDKIHGGKGDDIITNSGTDIGETDMLHGEEGNDVIHGGSGLALVFGNQGQDFLIAGPDGKEVFGGTENDFILGGEGDDFLLGNEGDDWIEGGNGFDGIAGDNSELNFNSSILGHDVMFAGQNEQDFDAESGDDIMVQGESVMRNEGMHGFDWAIHKGSQKAADSDLARPIFTTDEQDILRNRFDQVEALSGWEKDDVLRGDSRTAGGNGEPVPGVVDETGFRNNELTQAGVDRINGLRELLGTLVPDKPTSGNLEAATAFQGNILLGGGGSDLIEGRGGDDFIDGDMWLNVRIGIHDKDNNLIGSAEGMTSKVVDADGNALYGGRSLSSLMLDRTLNPSQLGIIREVLDGNKADDIDTAVFSGNRSDYSFTRLDTVTLRVVDNRGIDSSEEGDVISRIESFRFADGTFTFDELANRPPVILNSDSAPLVLTVNENTAAGSTVVQLAAVDPDGTGTLTWSISAGNENGLFAIDSVTGLIRLAASPNYEDLAASGITSQTLMVTVSDGQLSADQQITINITDINEAPGTGGPDSLAGGDNVIYAHAGDSISGGAGRDVLYMVDDTPASLSIDVAGIEYVAAGFGNDTIIGAGHTGTIEVYASGGDDSVSGGSGHDWLWGSVGNDTLIGNAGDDVIVGDLGADSLSGGDGNDRIYVDAQDTIDGGAGFDAAYISGGTGMAINLAATRFEWVTDFVNGNDTLDASGTTTGVELYAGGGNDLLTGGSGDDLVFAGEGADTLVGGAGDDGLIGEGGGDSISGGTGNDRIYADASDTVDGGDGYDIMYMVTDAAFTADLGAIRVEWLFAGGGNDTVSSFTATPIQVYANGGNDTVSGGGGNDTLWGGDGDDSLAGNAGADILVGGAGSDTINGGAGDDALHGGDGADVFVIGADWGNDTIFDWQDGVDLIDARALAAFGVQNVGGLSITAAGSNAVVGYAGNTLTIVGAAGMIDAADFLFA